MIKNNVVRNLANFVSETSFTGMNCFQLFNKWSHNCHISLTPEEYDFALDYIFAASKLDKDVLAEAISSDKNFFA